MIFLEPQSWNSATERLHSLGLVPVTLDVVGALGRAREGIGQVASHAARAANTARVQETRAAIDSVLAGRVSGGAAVDLLRAQADLLEAGGTDLELLLNQLFAVANAYNPNQPRIPRGQSRGEQWTAARLPNSAHKLGLDPNSLGKGFARHREMILQDLADASRITTDPENALTNLRAKLKVKNPVKASQVIGTIRGATAAEIAKIEADVQGVLDMLPPRIAKKLPAFNVIVSNRPAWNCYGSFNQSHMDLELNRAHGGVTQAVIWHEVMHWVHNNGPKSYAARVQEHYRRRTAGESLQNSAFMPPHRRDQFPEGYMGRSYIHRPDDGCEIPSMNVEYLSSDRLGAPSGQRNGITLNGRVYVDMKGLFRPGAHQDTAAVALSIFYYGRRRKKGGRP